MLNANDFKKKQIVFLFTNEGDKLSFLNDNIIVKNKEGGIKYQSTCYRLFMICVVAITAVPIPAARPTFCHLFIIFLISAHIFYID